MDGWMYDYIYIYIEGGREGVFVHLKLNGVFII